MTALIDIRRQRLLAAEAWEVPYNFRKYAEPLPEIVAMNPEYWETAKTWHSVNVLATGPVGVGKSSLCRFLLCRAIMDGKSVYDLTCAEIEGWTRLGYEQAERVDRAKFTGVLLLDDIDNVEWSAKGVNLLRAILERRHESQRTTLVTSNKNPNQLFELFKRLYNGNDDAVLSLLERTRPRLDWAFKGISYRRHMTATEVQG